MSHTPVLLKEVIESFNPQPNENFIDATLGAGGHSLAILNKTAPSGKLLALDLNKEAIREFKKIINQKKIDSERVILVNDNFVNLKRIVEKLNFSPVNGIIFDLGLSSDLLERGGKGFSFQRDEFLDMRFGDSGLTAYEVVNQFSRNDLEMIFEKYGEESNYRLIAREIIDSRHRQKIKTSQDLVAVIKRAVKEKVPERFMPKVLARIFQAIRITVNNELENLEKALSDTLEILTGGGRIGVISFHSLEDRIVKNFFHQQKFDGKLKILTKKPIVAGFEERQVNSRSRSAKFRFAIKLSRHGGTPPRRW